MSISNKAKLLGAAAAAVIASALLVLSIQTFMQSNLSQASSETASTGTYDFATLDREKGQDDVLNASVRSAADSIGDGGVNLESVRLLGSSSGVSYWAALDRSDNVCLIFELKSETIGFSCVPAEQFNKQGALAGVENMLTGEYLEARLVPDRVQPVEDSRYQVVVAGVIVIDDSLHTQSGSQIEIPVRSGEPFTFSVMGEVPRDQL